MKSGTQRPLSDWLKPMSAEQLKQWSPSPSRVDPSGKPSDTSAADAAKLEEEFTAGLQHFFAFSEELEQAERRTQRMCHQAKRTGWIDPGDNRVLARVAIEVERAARQAARRARAQLLELVGEITSLDGMAASTSVLFLVTQRRTLRTEVMFNTEIPKNWELPIETQNIVSSVARSGEPRWSDTSDKDYQPAHPHTKCELAIPIRFGDETLGVLNLESIVPNALASVLAPQVRPLIAAMVPHLLVLRSLDGEPSGRCPWHYEEHGWDFQELLGAMCRSFADELGMASTKCTVWYIDHAKEDVFAYSTCGYDWPYHQRNRGWALANFPVLRDLSNETYALCPQTETGFIDPDKAALLEISHGLMRKVIGSQDARNRPQACITVYFNPLPNKELARQRDALAKEALPRFAVLIAGLINTYQRQRPALAQAVAAAEYAKQGETALATWLELAIGKFCQIAQSPAGSLFGYQSELDRLVCVASTGFRKTGSPDAHILNELEPTYHQVAIPLGKPAHTIAAFALRGKALRRNRLSHREEKGLPPGCPVRGGTSHPEFIAGESIEGWQHHRRRFLACGIVAGGQTIGVLRLVRLEHSLPFTQCDQRLIEVLAQQIAEPLRRRLEEMRPQPAVASSNQSPHDQQQHRAGRAH